MAGRCSSRARLPRRSGRARCPRGRRSCRSASGASRICPPPEAISQLVAPGREEASPPLCTLDARPHNLPVHPTPLLGRTAELAALRRLFEDGARLVTILGPGGAGKTRLALKLAADL